MQMIIKICAWFCSALLLGCANNQFIAQRSRDDIQDLYKRGDGGEAITCQLRIEPNVCGGSNLPTTLFFDCSDEQFECVFDTRNVMAVPRAGLEVGQKYSVFGASLAVERCFGDQHSCEIAVISSKCTDSSNCWCRPNGHRGRTVFYFSPIRGVVAFYTVPEDVSELANKEIGPSLIADAIPMLTYFLVADRGLLKAPLTLEKASSNLNPRRPDCGG